MIYQSTHDQAYLDDATQIYDWVWHHLYDSMTGLVDAAIDESNVVDTSANVYNQGTFVDFANLLYELTGKQNYFDDAKRSIDYVKNHMTTNGVISNKADYLNTWADDFARGLGHFTRDHRQWDTYYPWFAQNATAIWDHRRTDYNITWNGWADQTPSDDGLTTSKFASAVAWFQFTPATKPDDTGGVHVIVSKKYGLAIDNGGMTGNGTGIVQSAMTGAATQQWLLTQNDDTSWNIINVASWMALDVPASKKAIGTQMVQWPSTRNDNQRWWIDLQPDGSYEISNKATGGALVDITSSGDCALASGCPLVQTTWTGGTRQRWLLQ
jgi:hypothetical protein